MYYYAISDIHGYFNILKETMNFIDLKSRKNKLIFLGDYIDYGEDSAKVLYYIKQLSEEYKNQIIVLRGNHEEYFLEWLNNPIEMYYWFNEDRDLKTCKTFISKKEFSNLMNEKLDILTKSKLFANNIKENHKDLIAWIKKLPYYFQTDKQIFVHAGINEEAEKLWHIGTSKEYFTSKYPAQIGKFYKDIIAGHIGTSEIKKCKEFHDVFYDGQSHYYIDGSVQISNSLLVLKYDTETCTYTSFRKKEDRLEEYEIK